MSRVKLKEIIVEVTPAKDGGCAYVERLDIIDEGLQTAAIVSYNPENGELLRGDNLVLEKDRVSVEYVRYVRMRDA